MPRPTLRPEGAVGQPTSLPLFSFHDIETPGAYLELETGRLFRIQPNALMPGHSPLISISCTEAWRYAKVSDDPNIPISKARVIAADTDLVPNF